MEHKVEWESNLFSFGNIKCVCGQTFFATSVREARDKFVEHTGPKQRVPSSPVKGSTRASNFPNHSTTKSSGSVRKVRDRESVSN